MNNSSDAIAVKIPASGEAGAPTHRLLARMGKKVLRPGGMALTRIMVDKLCISSKDHVVEFAPGIGATATLTFKNKPASYTGIERECASVEKSEEWLPAEKKYQVIQGSAEKNDLESGSATVIYGEAMLTMQTEDKKRAIVKEAFRILKPGGRYGIHELCLIPDDMESDRAEQIRKDISRAVSNLAMPLTGKEWEAILVEQGFEVPVRIQAKRGLLHPVRMVQDEGLLRAISVYWRMLWDKEGRDRLLTMSKVFGKHKNNLAAICIIACKPCEMAESRSCCHIH